MSVPKSKSSHCFDHSTDQYSGRCHGCTAVPKNHGSFHRPIASVFRVYDPTGTRSRRCQTRCLRDTRRLNTSESKARVRTPAFGLRIGRFISASDSLFSDAWWTIFLFHKNAFRGSILIPRKWRSIADLAGFHLTLAIIFNAQVQLYRHAGAEDDDL